MPVAWVHNAQRPTIKESDSAAADYCRQARRLRSRYGHSAARLHQSLRDLADQADARGQIAPVTKGAAITYAHEVARRLEGRILRYSQRVRLLRRADALGIGRFEANLIIATVHHKARGSAELLAPPGRKTRLWQLAAAVALEAGLVAAAWLLFRA